MHTAVKKLFLVIPARPPGQHAADVQIFPKDVPHHVFGPDSRGRAFIV